MAVVNISPPLKPNGVVSIYRLFSNDTRGTDVVVSIVNNVSVLPLSLRFLALMILFLQAADVDYSLFSSPALLVRTALPCSLLVKAQPGLSLL